MRNTNSSAPRGGATEHEESIIADCEARRLVGFARSAAIIHLLKCRGLTLRAVSEREGVCRQGASNALRSPWPRMEKAIAEALSTRPERLWPERYTATGDPLHGSRAAS